MARELGSERRCCIDGAQAVCAEVPAAGRDLPHQQAVITDAPLLRWEPSLHWAFPASFREQARALLQCWQRLAFSSGGGGSAAAPTSSGSGDVEMEDAEEGPAADLGCLPFELVRLLWVGAGCLCVCGPGGRRI